MASATAWLPLLAVGVNPCGAKVQDEPGSWPESVSLPSPAGSWPESSTPWRFCTISPPAIVGNGVSRLAQFYQLGKVLPAGNVNATKLPHSPRKELIASCGHRCILQCAGEESCNIHDQPRAARVSTHSAAVLAIQIYALAKIVVDVSLARNVADGLWHTSCTTFGTCDRGQTLRAQYRNRSGLWDCAYRKLLRSKLSHAACNAPVRLDRLIIPTFPPTPR